MLRKYDLVIAQGSDYGLQVVLQQPLGTPMNLYGFTAQAEIRLYAYDDIVISEITCTIAAVSYTHLTLPTNREV